jgi:hypothetical protein
MSEQSSSTNVSGSSTDTVEIKDLSPYAAAKVMTILTGEETAPQTLYGYARSGRIESNHEAYAAGLEPHVVLRGASFAQYAKDVMDGKVQPRVRQNYDKLAAQFTAAIEQGDLPEYVEDDEPEATEPTDQADEEKDEDEKAE